MSEQAPEKALAAVKAEGKRQADGSVIVPLVTDEGTVDITVPPPALWYEGAVDALQAGQITKWVELAVEDPLSIAAWRSVRKRYRDLDAFLTAWVGASGEDPGESQGSSAS